MRCRQSLRALRSLAWCSALACAALEASFILPLDPPPALGWRRLKEAAVALKLMYDEDLADEEIIVAWHDRAGAAPGWRGPAAR